MNKINKEEIDRLLTDLAANVGYVLPNSTFNTSSIDVDIKFMQDSKQIFWIVPKSVLNDKENVKFRTTCIDADIIDTVCTTSFPWPSDEEDQVAIILVDLTRRRRGSIKFVDASRWDIADETGMAAVCNMLIHDLFPGEDLLAFQMAEDVMDDEIDERWDEQVRLVSALYINSSLAPQDYILKPVARQGFVYKRLDEIFMFVNGGLPGYCDLYDSSEYPELHTHHIHNNIMYLRIPAIFVSVCGELHPQKVIPNGNTVSVDMNDKIALFPLLDIDLDYLVEQLSKESTIRQLPFLPYPNARLKEEHLWRVLIEVPEKTKED